MSQVNIHEAKTHLSRLLEQVVRGEDVIIAKSGKPIARLTKLAGPRRRPGRLKGEIRIADDFDAPLPPALVAAFWGEAD